MNTSTFITPPSIVIPAFEVPAKAAPLIVEPSVMSTEISPLVTLMKSPSAVIVAPVSELAVIVSIPARPLIETFSALEINISSSEVVPTASVSPDKT